MDKLTYRAATGGDIAFINETYLENIASLHGVARSAAFWEEKLSAQDSTYYIVHCPSPVAWFRTEEEDGEFWLGMLQVKPIYQHQGVGRYVLSVAEDIAREKGYQRLGIHTTEDNLPARGLYSAAGYRVTEIGPCTTADGIERVGYTFQKDL